MKRRSFLQWAVAAPLIARVEPVLPKTRPDLKEVWFDQTAFKPPSEALLQQLELIERTKARMVSITGVMWREQLQPALEEVFSREYDKLSGEEWKKMWLGEWEIGNDVSTKGSELDARLLRQGDRGRQDRAQSSVPRRSSRTRPIGWWDEE